jgi:hypothetical protein
MFDSLKLTQSGVSAKYKPKSERFDGVDYWRQALQYEYDRSGQRVSRVVWWIYKIHAAWLKWLTLRIARRQA